MGTYDTVGGSPRHNPEFDRDTTKECIECAKASGYSEDEAENCEDGGLKCRVCPFINGAESEG